MSLPCAQLSSEGALPTSPAWLPPRIVGRSSFRYRWVSYRWKCLDQSNEWHCPEDDRPLSSPAAERLPTALITMLHVVSVWYSPCWLSLCAAWSQYAREMNVRLMLVCQTRNTNGHAAYPVCVGLRFVRTAVRQNQLISLWTIDASCDLLCAHLHLHVRCLLQPFPPHIIPLLYFLHLGGKINLSIDLLANHWCVLRFVMHSLSLTCKMPFAAFPSPHHPTTLFFAPWRKNKFGTKIEFLASTTLTYSPCSSDKSIVASSPHSTFVFVTKNKFPLLLSRTFTTCSCACLRHESIYFTESDLCWLLLHTYHLYLQPALVSTLLPPQNFMCCHGAWLSFQSTNQLSAAFQICIADSYPMF